VKAGHCKALIEARVSEIERYREDDTRHFEKKLEGLEKTIEDLRHRVALLEPPEAIRE